MVGDITIDELELLNSYQILGPSGQRALKDYLRYLLCKQYRREVMVAVFHNKLIHNLFHSLLHIAEKDDLAIEQVAIRVEQIKELYYGIFEQIHHRYSEHIKDLDSNEIVREFGRNSFTNIERALESGDISLIRLEIIEFYQEYNKLSKKRDTMKIVAV
ncbi:MAG: hypothetical protein PHT79_06565 [Syntrophomonadaceae bacterium]|nr:hypothetical protein [Syntrophomonadaceae bacterium]MDD3889048.1 hypothetical protein [Syntrophomonadaceae bacterium]MDD4549406.1 hypothetical protein [Syntrophomonadaceae bacterium]